MGFLDLTPLTTATDFPRRPWPRHRPSLLIHSRIPILSFGNIEFKGTLFDCCFGSFFTALFNVQGLVQIALLSSVCYGLSFAWPTSKHIPVVVIVLSLSVLAANHLKSQFFSDVDAPRFDQTIPMMVAVQKMATFAWCARWHSSEQSNLLDYLGFIFFYPAFILGPSFHYKTYSDFISGTGAFTLQPTQKLLPGRWKYLAETIITGAVCSLLNIIFAPRVPYEFGLTDAFLNTRGSNVPAISLLPHSCNRCSSLKGKSVYKWNRCENVRIWELEFPENPRMFMSAWNVQTALWLRSAIYLRLAPEPLPDQTPAEITKSNLWRLFYQLCDYWNAVTNSRAGLTVWRRLYFYVHVGVVLLFALDSLQSMLGGGKKRKPRGEVVVEDKRVVSDADAEEKRVKVE
ncbi:hypothetical protein BCR33DRAFT_783734 [Rhizoclosmatium globosum]|uniref:Uncharacterized protein n=1 Tax=Rhizoclosmatium globosum TaxID=329046 RepID=A0A1Y2CJV6_9FUNG|nr:hypothetical protein BCR33DRAFT_783734 [Rhizoclosmatium globosum]|eukprot:ORY46625.1 hypothetical protein BCR33DRAFT_783734 [Rhizoclosmatium globosum]